MAVGSTYGKVKKTPSGLRSRNHSASTASLELRLNLQVPVSNRRLLRDCEVHLVQPRQPLGTGRGEDASVPRLSAFVAATVLPFGRPIVHCGECISFWHENRSS